MDVNLIESLLYEEEGETLDFKRDHYRFGGGDALAKSELLKDILAFANTRRLDDAHILVGAKGKQGERKTVFGINEDIDEASIQQFVNEKTNRPITFSYKTLAVEGKKVGLYRIPPQTLPFFVRKDYGIVRQNIVYIRRGSSTAEATPDFLVEFGRKSVEIPKPPDAVLSSDFSYIPSSRNGEDEVYQFRLKVKNECETIIDDYRVEVEFPNKFLNQSTIYGYEIPDRRAATHRFFRILPEEYSSTIYPGDKKVIFTIDFIVNQEIRDFSLNQELVIDIFAEPNFKSNTRTTMREFLETPARY